MVQSVLEYGGQKIRSNDLFGQDTPIAMTKKFLKGLKVSKSGSENNDLITNEWYMVKTPLTDRLLLICYNYHIFYFHRG